MHSALTGVIKKKVIFSFFPHFFSLSFCVHFLLSSSFPACCQYVVEIMMPSCRKMLEDDFGFGESRSEVVSELPIYCSR